MGWTALRDGTRPVLLALTMGARGMVDRCLDAANGDSHRALILAVRMTRYRLIANHQLAPHPAEPLPLEVRHARDRALRAAA